MARVLMMTMTAPSHINARVALAQHLLGLGHHVGWLCTRRPDPRLAQLGVEVFELPDPPAMSRITGEARMRMVGDEHAELGQLRKMFLGPFLDQIESVRGVLRTFRPDVVALDGNLYHHVVATQLEQIPWATVSSGLWLVQPRSLDYPMRRMASQLEEERRAFFDRHGMRPEVRLFECVSPALNVVATTTELVGEPADWPTHTIAAGPMLPTKPRGDEVELAWERLRTDCPIVYLAMGTGFYWNPEIVRAAASACAELGAQLVASVMDLAAHDAVRGLPGDPLIVQYVPQLEMLARVTAFVTHGGASSVREALNFGVPQIVVPMSLDQPVQAYFVEHAGAGVALERTAFTAESCRDALAPMLDPRSQVRRRATAIGNSYRAIDGCAVVAERLLAMIGSKPEDLRA
ncbi:MAG: ydhE [Myxococcales bacterium]|nr:ydhE [Myxococcales bacterium]